MADVDIVFPGNLGSVATIANLRALDSDFFLLPVPIVVGGTLTVGDGGGGIFIWSNGSTATDNGQSIVKPDDRTSLQAGRWILAPSTVFDQPASSKFWTSWDAAAAGFPAPPDSTGANIQRINNRLFVGDATVNSGDFPATVKDYIEAYEASHSHPLGFRTSWAQFAALATNGGIGGLFGSRSSDSQIDGLQLGQAVWATAINDNATQQQNVTAVYGVAWREPGTGMGDTSGRGSVGAEFDVANLGATVQIFPGNLYPKGFTTALQLNSGAYYAPATSASAALSIGWNRADFLSGIVIAQNAIAGLTYDGSGNATGGGASAVRMGAFHQIEWWNNAGSAPTSYIKSEQLTPANAQGIVFTDSGINIGGPSSAGLAFATVYPGGATGAWLTATPANGSNPATLGILGGSANQNLRLRAKGTGTISFGTYTAGALTPTGYITIADDAGTPRRVLVG